MIRRALIALALLIALLAGLAAALPWLAEPALRLGLRLAGLEELAFDRLRLGWGELELEGAALGTTGQGLERLRVTYRLPDLLEGRLERVEIDGLVVRARWTDGRLQPAGFETAGGEDAGGLPLPSAEQVVLRDARLEVATGLGEVVLPLAADIRRAAGQMRFTATADARLAPDEGAIEARIEVDGDLPQGAPLAIASLRAQGRIALDADGAALAGLGRLDGTGTLAFDLDRGRLQAEAADLTLGVEHPAPGPWQARLGEGRIELAAEGLPDALHGTLGVALAQAGWSATDLAASGLSLRQQLDWAFAAGTLTLAAREAGSLRIESLAGPDATRAGPLQLRLEPGDRPLLELAIEDGAPRWRQAWTGAIEAFEAQVGTPPLALQSQAGTITLALEGRGAALAEGHMALAAAQLRLPGHALALDGITTAAGWTAAGLVDGAAIPLTVRRISHGGRPAWFAPLALEGKLVPATDRLAFDATVARIGGGASLTIRGEHQPSSGAGRAAVELAPVTFGPDLQPRDLAPIARDLVTDVAGEVALSGDLAWRTDRLGSPDGIEGDVAVLAEALALSAGPARFEQVNGVVRLDRLWPPATPPDQQLAIGLLDLGLPLTDGVMTFALTPARRLEVAQLAWRFAGGTVRAEPFSLGSPPEDVSVTLRAEQLDLARLFELTRLDGLTGEGSLDGVLPVRLSDGAAIIEGGELAATGPGVLRYRADAAPQALQGGEGVDLLLQALENFRYEVLKITLDGRTDAAMDIGLHLSGANPDLYDGYPIEFNLDLEGELGNILRQGVASYQIPDRIRERMQGFAR